MSMIVAILKKAAVIRAVHNSLVFSVMLLYCEDAQNEEIHKSTHFYIKNKVLGKRTRNVYCK